MKKRPRTYSAYNAAGQAIRVTIPPPNDTAALLEAWKPVVEAACRVAAARDEAKHHDPTFLIELREAAIQREVDAMDDLDRAARSIPPSLRPTLHGSRYSQRGR